MSTIEETRSTSKIQDPPCLLTYRFSTNPEPLQISTGQTPTNGRINLSVSTNASVFCDKILIAIPIGSEATDLSEQTPSASVNTAKWSVSSIEIKTGKELGITDPEKAEASYASFAFETRDLDDNHIDYNLVFGLSATINQASGDFDYRIQETSGTTNDPTTFTLKEDSFQLEKALPRFYVKNLIAATTEATTIPCTQFANAADIRFSWESNGTLFQLFEKNNTTPIYSGADTTFTLSPGVATDTTFVLVASVTSAPDDEDLGDYEPIYLYESLSISISNPDLTPNTNKVFGGETIGGTLDVSGAASTGPLTASELTVNGNMTSESITANGTITAAGISSTSSSVSSNLSGSFINEGYQPTIRTSNSFSDPSIPMGIHANVATKQDWGLVSNGQIGSTNSTSLLTHIPTRNGHRVVTSPLSPKIEVYLNGQGRLSKGQATITLKEEFADMILHSDGSPYKVLLTPSSQCNGLAVVEKTSNSFTVEELANGNSNAGFDWFLISAKPEELNSAMPHTIPEALPQILDPASA